MSLDASWLQRAASPASSGRSSPFSSRPRLGAEDARVSIKKDKNYRRYASAVERALSLFDTALQEWADYISFLARLLKALHIRPTAIAEIPHKSLVARRLAQCLNPLLPSGVHQKTIEVYTYIFNVLGIDGLARDLPLYLPGLSPTLSYASLSIKPALLSLFETHILALENVSLRPALKALLMALLPGLEEESSEEFERTHSILIKLKAGMGQSRENGSQQRDISGDQYYWQCLFLASITSNSRRQGALAFMVRNLPQLGNLGGKCESSDPQQGINRAPPDIKDEALSAIEAVSSPEPGLLVRSFIAGLRDEQLLIQRGFLDLLVTHLPLHSDVLQHKATRKDIDRLVAAAASVVARREMSLNRRLWTWFLGPDLTPESQPSAPVISKFSGPGNASESSPGSKKSHHTYFERYSLETLVRSILKMIQSSSVTPSEKARPFRICLSLMDRWEIGGAIMPQVLLPLLESVWQYQSIAPSPESFEEVFRSASAFFDGVESGLIWGEISRFLASSLGIGQTRNDGHDGLGLISFIVTKFNIREEEMQTIHMPIATLMIVTYLVKDMQGSDGPVNTKTAERGQTALKTALTLFDLIPERAFAKGVAAPPSNGLEEGISELTAPSQNFAESAQIFYAHYQESVDQASVPCSGERIGQLLLHNIVQLVLQEIRMRRQIRHLEMELSLLEKATRKITRKDSIDSTMCMMALVHALEDISNRPKAPASIEPITGITSALETFSIALPSEIWRISYQMRQVITDLVTHAWPWLSPSKPSDNVEAVRCVWRLQSISPDLRLIEGCIATLMTDDCKLPSGGGELEGARRFTTLWAHSSSSIYSLHSRRPSYSRTLRLGLENDTSITTPEMVILERPLMLLLDSLSEPKAVLSAFTANWLQSLPTVNVVLQSLLKRLRISKLLHGCPTLTTSKITVPAPYEISDLTECQYVLQVMTNLVVCSPGNTWAALVIKDPLGDESQASGVLSATTPLMPASTNDYPTTHAYLIHTCLIILGQRFWERVNSVPQAFSLQRTATSLLQHMLQGQTSLSVPHSVIEGTVIAALTQSVKQADKMLQVPLMDLLVTLMRTRIVEPEGGSGSMHQRTLSGNYPKSLQRSSVSAETSEKEMPSPAALPLPPALLDCLLFGLSAPSSYPVLEHWIQFLDDCLTFYAENTFRILMPLVDCFKRTIRTVFGLLQAVFEGQDISTMSQEPLITLHSLLNGLERSLARAHERLIQHEAGIIPLKTPEQSQGFFGNMVSGVFASELNKSRHPAANNRLTVILCFKDAILVCLDLWTWASHGQNSQSRDSTSSPSLNYISLRLKNRTRRILEHLFAAEALESLESLIEVWCQSHHQDDTSKSLALFNLLHVLDGSRPKNTIPALFNAIYSRTNPNALEPGLKSTLTADLSDITLADFLVRYMQSLEDDAMDEIWNDCMTFLRDVLANPLPQRQTLPRLLEFTAILGEKVNNTNFGEQRRMRRDLGDLFVRLLAATFAAKPLSFAQDDVRLADSDGANMKHSGAFGQTQSDDIVVIVALLLPKFSKILVDGDRIAAASSIISLQILTPTIQSKTYPHNVLPSTLGIFLAMSRIPEASKSWRKTVAEAFNDPRFFCTSSLSLAEEGWIPVLRQWTLLDKDRMQDYLSRIMPPTAAGIMFGVGASSARNEADRKTQLILRRMALLVLAAAEDTYIVNLVGIQEKILELLTATAASSPSSAIRAELYMLLGALVLKTSAVHMASFWPIISSELYETLSSLFPGEQHDTHNVHCILQACKLLDALVMLAPDDFQLREWLFITDTVDAVYRPHGWSPVALVDELAADLDLHFGGQSTAPSPMVASVAQMGKRRPLLTSESFKDVSKGMIVDRVLKPFFRQLSINAFESTYVMEAPDWKACYDTLLGDLFDDSTMA